MAGQQPLDPQVDERRGTRKELGGSPDRGFASWSGGANAIPVGRYLGVLIPATVLATLAATACLWLIS